MKQGEVRIIEIWEIVLEGKRYGSYRPYRSVRFRVEAQGPGDAKAKARDSAAASLLDVRGMLSVKKVS
jgi:hypothetical protein